MIGSVFRYAVVTLRATNDPTAPLRGALLTPRFSTVPPSSTNESLAS